MRPVLSNYFQVVNDILCQNPKALSCSGRDEPGSPKDAIYIFLPASFLPANHASRLSTIDGISGILSRSAPYAPEPSLLICLYVFQTLE